jgi:hypothetical protein
MSKYPKQGTLYNKDYSLKLEYEFYKKDKEKIYKFKVYQLRYWDGIKREYRKNNNEPITMNENEFMNYLQTELYKQ